MSAGTGLRAGDGALLLLFLFILYILVCGGCLAVAWRIEPFCFSQSIVITDSYDRIMPGGFSTYEA
jgi:hypothetical protein